MTEEWTVFQNRVADLFEDSVYDESGNVLDEEALGSYLALVNGPEQYEVEDQMMDYLDEHPDASLKEMEDYFWSICPEGDPPCASEWGDDEDE